MDTRSGRIYSHDQVLEMPTKEVAEFFREINPTPIQNARGRVSRNDPCPCGSGKKFKRCCLVKVNS